MVMHLDDASSACAILRLPRTTALRADGEVNHFANGSAAYRYSSHGFTGWVVDVTSPAVGCVVCGRSFIPNNCESVSCQHCFKPWAPQCVIPGTEVIF